MTQSHSYTAHCVRTSSLVFIPTLEDKLLLVSSPRLRTSSQCHITNISGPTSDGSSIETFIEGLLYAKYNALSVSMYVHACATTLRRRSYNSLQRCEHLTQGPRAHGKKLLPTMVSNLYCTGPGAEQKGNSSYLLWGHPGSWYFMSLEKRPIFQFL